VEVQCELLEFFCQCWRALRRAVERGADDGEESDRHGGEYDNGGVASVACSALLPELQVSEGTSKGNECGAVC